MAVAADVVAVAGLADLVEGAGIARPAWRVGYRYTFLPGGAGAGAVAVQPGEWQAGQVPVAAVPGAGCAAGARPGWLAAGPAGTAFQPVVRSAAAGHNRGVTAGFTLVAERAGLAGGGPVDVGAGTAVVGAGVDAPEFTPACYGAGRRIDHPVHDSGVVSWRAFPCDDAI